MAMQENPKGVLLSSHDRDRMTKLGEETLHLVKEMDLIIARTLGVEPSKSPESVWFKVMHGAFVS